MLDGKVADPEDQTRQFALNGYAYLGLARSAEMLANCRPDEAERLSREAQALKKDIRTALAETMERCPVIPLGDGRWVPTAPSWAETSSPTFLLADGHKWHTHGTFVARESLLGPQYLIFQEVLKPDEPMSDWLVEAQAELLHMHNVAFSQPFYSRHPWIHLQRGEVKAFLKAYYNGFSGLADRETYSFWEHYFHASPHKTHEEAWFLMQTRWMLYMETGDSLHLLSGVPRAWLGDGKRIRVERAGSYFGPLSFEVTSNVVTGSIRAQIECDRKRKPNRVMLRLPHPAGKKAKRVSVGTYDPDRESVLLDPFPGASEVVLEF
jgi:hypothetical protein